MTPLSARALRTVTALLVALAALWLGYEFWRLVVQDQTLGAAVDLRQRIRESSAWAEGRAVYALPDAVYPPASYLLMWPITGWFGIDPGRWLWLPISVASLAWLTQLFTRYSGALPGPERTLLTVLPLATYAVGATIGNGQISILVLCCLLASLPLLVERAPSWRRDLGIASLFLLALVKPSVTGHFFWLLVFVPGAFRVACLVGVGYVALTALAAVPQPRTPLELFQDWAHRAVEGVKYGASLGQGSIDKHWNIKSVNLHSVLARVDGLEWIRDVTVVVLVVLGAWVWRHRRVSIWTLIGVTALVAKFSGYHGWYDDVLLLLPLITLLRLARAEGAGRAPAVLLVLLVGSMLAPGGIYLLPQPWASVYAIGQTAVWLAVLGYLVVVARRER